MPLAQCKDGEQYTITNIQGTHCREQVLRMGFCEGSTLLCITNIHRGPVVVRHMHTDVGIGRGMAERIFVEPCKTQQVSTREGTAHGILSSGYRFRHGQRHGAKR
ncbi:MAG: FeoA family protein [Limnochordia bacterium]|jgi:Fe2+ transport system protein FeoA